jgi:hypothetical protein
LHPFYWIRLLADSINSLSHLLWFGLSACR